MRIIVNGEVRQEGNTDEMEWDMNYLVADTARIITRYISGGLDESLRDDVEEAADVCPLQAITVD